MTYDEFKSTLSHASPPEDLAKPLQALWWEAAKDWHKAHNIVQVLQNADAYWVHAYLHRVEGDLGNSNYWYHRAGREMPNINLEAEWEHIVLALLAN